LLKDCEYEIEALTLIPSDEGRFEVMLNDTLIYSKLNTGRHANPGEIITLVKRFAR